jgi:hypothetical protein
MKEIGGYFGLELGISSPYHKNALALSTSRNCLQYILAANGYTRVIIPYYTCESVLEPIRNLELDVEFYHVGRNLEPVFNRSLQEGEVFLYTNYFGIKGDIALQLSRRFSGFALDNSQAFFSSPFCGTDTFYSARKFFGVPDGAYLYAGRKLKMNLKRDYSFERMSHLLKRIDISASAGYEDFKANEHTLSRKEIRRMSALTEMILSYIRYDMVREIREKNFAYVHKRLKDINELHINPDNNIGPLAYPFLRKGNNELKGIMHRQKIYVATYWPNVFSWCNPQDDEFYLADNIIPVPIDQRISVHDLKRIIELIKT